jgi:outer membrane protein
MIRRYFGIAAIALLAQGTQAAEFEAQIGWHSWNSTLAGDVNTGNEQALQVDLEEDLGFDNERSRHIYAHLEHPLPAAPNIKLQHTFLNKQQEAQLTRDISYNDLDFQASENISTDVDLTHTDITFYYLPVEYDLLTIGLGLTVRLLDGSIEIESRDREATTRHLIDEPIPAAYVMLRSDLPFNLRLMVEANGLAFDNDSLIDATAKLSYTPIFGLGIEAGWRYIEISLNDLSVENTSTGLNNSLDANVRIHGAFVGLQYRF